MIILLLVIALLLFGAKRLPEIGRSLGTRDARVQGLRLGSRQARRAGDAADGASARGARLRRRVGRARASARTSRLGPARGSAPAASRPRRGGDARRAPRRAPHAAPDLARRARHRRSCVAFAFHERLIDALKRPLPAEHEKLTTLTVGEPFMTVDLGQPLRRLPARAADHPLAGVGVLHPGRRGRPRPRDCALRRARDRPARVRARLRVLRRAAGGDGVPDELRRGAVRHPDPRPRLHLVRGQGDRRDGRRLRAADLRRRADAAGDPLDGAAAPRAPRRVLRRRLHRRRAAGRRSGHDHDRDDPADPALRALDLASASCRPASRARQRAEASPGL